MEPKLSNIKFTFKKANKNKSIFIRLTADLNEAITKISSESGSNVSDVARGLMEAGFALYKQRKESKKGKNGR